MGGPNLEVFKFGLYIMFPIGWMYYFGTNLENRFTVPDFWPKPEQTHKIPFEKEDIHSELERLKQKRLSNRARRLATESLDNEEAPQLVPSQQMHDEPKLQEPTSAKTESQGGWIRRTWWK